MPRAPSQREQHRHGSAIPVLTETWSSHAEVMPNGRDRVLSAQTRRKKGRAIYWGVGALSALASRSEHLPCTGRCCNFPRTNPLKSHNHTRRPELLFPMCQDDDSRPAGTEQLCRSHRPHSREAMAPGWKPEAGS